MAGRGIASLIGLVGGLLIVMGGLLALLERLTAGLSPTTGFTWGGTLQWIAVFILGFAVLIVVRPRLFWWPGRRTFNALLLIGLGVVTWILGSSSLLAIIGGILAMIAGVVLVVEGFLPRSFPGRRLFHRY